MITENELLLAQMAVFLMFLLVVKHFIVDFVLQTEKMVMEKGTYGAWGGIYHSLGHAAFTWIALAWIDPLAAIFAAVFDFVVHYHVDWAKMNINKKYGWTPKDNQFWVSLGVDQLAHYLTYVLIVGWFAGAF